MNISQIYIAVAVVVLALTAAVVFFVGKKGGEKRLSPLASFAFAFVLAGTLFGDNRVIGYGLMGLGVVLAAVDILMQRNRRI